MTDFGTILKRGRRRYETKKSEGQWGRCESCDERLKLYPYSDDKGDTWMLCEECSDGFIKEEVE